MYRFFERDTIGICEVTFHGTERGGIFHVRRDKRSLYSSPFQRRHKAVLLRALFKIPKNLTSILSSQ